jgi:pleckstrin homology domain-containing family A member 1/2
VHSCTPVALKRHENTFGLISPIRTYYLQAKTADEMQEWVHAIDEARHTLMATSTQSSVTSPIPIPTSTQQSSSSHHPSSITPSPPSHSFQAQNITSSDSEDASPAAQRTYSSSSRDRSALASSPTKSQGFSPKDLGKVILSGYLMKCGSKRRNWRKRWFVLTGEKLVYSGSHMVCYFLQATTPFNRGIL